MSEHESAWQDLRGVTFRQRWIDVGGVSTRVLESGEDQQPTLVMLHGTGGHAEAYTRNLGPAGEHFHTYAIDCIGHGFTDKPRDNGYQYRDYVEHLRNFLDTIGVERAHLSGESMGGGISAWLALLHPDRVDRVVLNTGVAPLYSEETVTRLVALTRAASQNPTWDSVRKRLEFLMHSPDSVTDDLVATRLHIVSRPEMPEITELVLQRLADPVIRVENALTEAQWRQIQAPTLVVWTDDDPMAPPEVGSQVAGWLPNGSFALMENCGHWPQFEDAEVFNRIQLEFLLADTPTVGPGDDG